MIYAATFCQFVIGITFTLSFFAKVTDVPHFAKAVRNFQILPPMLAWPSAIFFLGSELSILCTLFVQPIIAFTLAAILLLLFSTALAIVLQRGTKTSCNCFGTSTKPITAIDLVRNFGLLLCAGCGLWLWPRATMEWSVAPLMLMVVGFAAVATVTLWTQLDEIYRLFQMES